MLLRKVQPSEKIIDKLTPLSSLLRKEGGQHERVSYLNFNVTFWEYRLIQSQSYRAVFYTMVQYFFLFICIIIGRKFKTRFWFHRSFLDYPSLIFVIAQVLPSIEKLCSLAAIPIIVKAQLPRADATRSVGEKFSPLPLFIYGSISCYNTSRSEM